MQQPPLLPEIVLARVYTTARRNGLSILIVASAGAVLQAAGRDVVGAVAALLAAVAGAMEIHGAGLLRQGVKEALAWMIRAELLLLGVILLYCYVRLMHPQLEQMRAAFHASLELPLMRSRWDQLQQLGFTEDMYLHLVNRLTCVALTFASLLYQGGMVYYYLRRRRPIEIALEAE
jgi:hypothetical protein